MKAFFFDLDGVLTDSRQGLFVSFRAALKSIGVAALSDSGLERFLGTPLPELFRTVKPAVNDKDIQLGIDAFRVAYESDGIKRNKLYPGMSDVLQAIVNRKDVAWIVTSKPEMYAKQVATILGIEKQLTGIVGAGLDEKDTKQTLIAQALRESGISNHDTTMLGDRHYDIEGATANGVRPVGALWGYGTREELDVAGCRLFVKTPKEFLDKFVNGSK